MWLFHKHTRTCSVDVRFILAAGLPGWDGADLRRELVLGENPVQLHRLQSRVLTGQSSPAHLLTEEEIKKEEKKKEEKLMGRPFSNPAIRRKDNKHAVTS